ncbi:Fic family protein [Candidatus Woesearchaeota archaeon]|nr:Fic family protein [Candidatus Woesearchaeota archaeon]
MAYVVKKKIGNKKYFYLVENTRIGKNKWKKYTKYIGKKAPRKTNILKFLNSKEIEKINNIKKQFLNNFKRMNESAKNEYFKNFSTVFTYDTSAIEGSELNLQDTRMVLREGITPKYSKVRDIFETKNHEKAFFEMLKHKKELNLDFILNIHRILKKDIDDEIEGKIRNCNLKVLNYRPPDYTKLKTELNKFFKWYKKSKSIMHTFELAGLIHLYFVCIHPFIDGNGRISRLLMNFILKKHNYPMLNIPYKNRQEYFSALADYDSGEGEKPFLKFLKRIYIKEYKII